MRYPYNNYKITAEYKQIGDIWGLGYHTGTDFVGREKEVKAITDGVVRVVTYDEKYGNYISIGTNDEKRILYCHLSSTNVVVGQEITEGMIIGIEGDTGNVTGRHLHLEVREAPYTSADTINPIEYIQAEMYELGCTHIRYNTLEEVPAWAKETIQKLIEKEFLRGDLTGLNLSEDMIRMFVINVRAGIYDLQMQNA